MQYLAVEVRGVVSQFFCLIKKTKKQNNDKVNNTNGKVLRQQRETGVCAAKFMFPERIWKS